MILITDTVQKQLWYSVLHKSITLCRELLHYTRENDVISVLEEKSLVFRSVDVLLAVDGLDIGGEKLQHVEYKILTKCNGTVRLTFLNKYWLNSSERKSVKVQQNTKKKAKNIEHIEEASK